MQHIFKCIFISIHKFQMVAYVVSVLCVCLLQAYALILSLTVVLAVIVFVAKTAVPQDVFYKTNSNNATSSSGPLNSTRRTAASKTSMPIVFNTTSSTSQNIGNSSIGQFASSTLPFVAITDPSTIHRDDDLKHIHPHHDGVHIPRYKSLWLDVVDYLCVFIFSGDFFARLLIAPHKCQHLRNTYTVIDLLSIVPFYMELIGPLITPHYNTFEAIQDFTISSMVEFLKISLIFRLLRIGRHYMGLQVLMYTLKTSVKDLLLMVVFVFLGTLFFATMLYFLEKKYQIRSIPIGFWWAIITMTTVGYGDYYPTTTLGMGVGCCCAMSGVLLIAFTVPILVNHFMLYYQHAMIVGQSNSVHRMAQKKLLSGMKNVKEKVASKAIIKNVKHLSTTLMQGRVSEAETSNQNMLREAHEQCTAREQSCNQASNGSLDRDSFYMVCEPSTLPKFCSQCHKHMDSKNQTVSFYNSNW